MTYISLKAILVEEMVARPENYDWSCIVLEVNWVSAIDASRVVDDFVGHLVHSRLAELDSRDEGEALEVASLENGSHFGCFAIGDKTLYLSDRVGKYTEQ